MWTWLVSAPCTSMYNIPLKVTFVAGSVLGITLLATFVLSLLVIIQRGTLGLKILNWVLLANSIAILFVGTYIWVFTLHERNNYHAVFGQQSNETKILIQDMVRSNRICDSWSCVDFFILYSSSAVVTSMLLMKLRLEALLAPIRPLQLLWTISASRPLPSLRIRHWTTFSGIFSLLFSHKQNSYILCSTVDGFMAIVIGFFLANMCVIKKVSYYFVLATGRTADLFPSQPEAGVRALWKDWLEAWWAQFFLKCIATDRSPNCYRSIRPIRSIKVYP